MDFRATQEPDGQDHLLHAGGEFEEAAAGGKAAASLYLYHYMNFYFK